MKTVLILVRTGTPPDRLEEAVRVAAGLAQQPALKVSLQLPALPQDPLPASLGEYLSLFASDGSRLLAEASWIPFLPPAALPLLAAPASDEILLRRFDRILPF